MEQKDRVILHGSWASPYVKRVELAFKLKGISFEYVEEDLRNKSAELLKHNPVHKSVPVIVHNGKTIAESSIILEYIDETWTNSPKLLPVDPYKRARARFWAQVIDFKSGVLRAEGEAQEKLIKELSEKLVVIEEGMKELYPNGSGSGSAMDAQNFGLVDVMLVSQFGTYQAVEEVLGMKLLDEEKTPLLFSIITALNKNPLVVELLPPHDNLVQYLKLIRQRALEAAASS